MGGSLARVGAASTIAPNVPIICVAVDLTDAPGVLLGAVLVVVSAAAVDAVDARVLLPVAHGIGLGGWDDGDSGVINLQHDYSILRALTPSPSSLRASPQRQPANDCEAAQRDADEPEGNPGDDPH